MNMKRRLALFSALLGLSLLTGCAETPNSSVVKQKGSQSIANYKEATEGTTENDAGTSGENTGGTADTSSAEVSSSGTQNVNEARRVIVS